MPAPPSLEVAPRPLTSTELLSGELESVAPPRRELGDVAPPRRRDVHGDETDEAVS